MKNFLINAYAKKTYEQAIRNYREENPSVLMDNETWATAEPATKDFWRSIAWRQVRLKSSNLFRQAWGWLVVIYLFGTSTLVAILLVLLAIFGGSIRIKINFESLIKLLQQISGS